MTRDRRAARHGRGTDSGAHWISYSDMMASLLLVFVLAVCYSIYQYYNMLAIKTEQLNQQQAELDRAQITLVAREDELKTAQATLMGKEEELAVIQIQLQQQESDLKAAQDALKTTETQQQLLQLRLNDQQSTLADQEIRLGAMQTLLDTQTARIDDLIGIRTAIIRDLSSALSNAHLAAKVDPQTGDIVLESSVFFQTNSFTILQEGQTLLNTFLPVYLGVLTGDTYKDYVAEIIIEGHTDSSGTYLNNLELSQNRALAVAKYCLSVPSLSSAQSDMFKQVLTAKGRSYSDLVYVNGVEDRNLSRRVEFKFRLKDTEMITEMERILSGMR